MSRPLRFQAAGLVYHVMARGNNKMAIFLDDLDHERFLELFADVVSKFELDSWVICLMPNHYHLVFRTRRPARRRAARTRVRRVFFGGNRPFVRIVAEDSRQDRGAIVT